MIRIQRDRCGYSGYTCTGITSKALEIKATHDGVIDHVPTGTTWEEISKMHNYQTLPTKLTGFLPTVEPIFVMQSSDLPVAEKACPSDIAAADYTAQYEKTDTDKQKLVHRYSTTDAYTSITTQLLQATDSSGNDQKQQPGLLEPVLDTALPVVNVEVTPATDQTLNAVLDRLNDMDTRITEAYAKAASSSDSSADSVAGLIGAMNEESGCNNFRIKLDSGNAVQYPGSTGRTPSYEVSDGIVVVNGEAIQTTGGLSFDGSATVYVNVTGSSGSYSAVLAESKSGKFSAIVGGVKEASANGYKVYQIWTADCYPTAELVHDVAGGASNRVIVYNSSSNKFESVETVECSEDPPVTSS